MRRKRYQSGSLQRRKHGKRAVWAALWRDETGSRRYRTLGYCSEMSHAEAMTALQGLVTPVNGRRSSGPQRMNLEQFIDTYYLPLFRRKWKRSTAGTSENRIQKHLVSGFGARELGEFNREELQAFLDRKVAEGLSRSTVDHLRWDLRSIFTLGHHEGIVVRNPAVLLYTSRDAKQTEPKVMNGAEVMKCLRVLDLRERLIVRLAVFAGMRPGEIFGLRWRHVESDHVVVEQRIYKGVIDTPKSRRSARKVALSPGILTELNEWRKLVLAWDAQGWVFPSENLATPLRPENVWRRQIGPKFKGAGLGWVNFQVMRRTYATLAHKAGADPKSIADQLGHGIGTSLDVYTRANIETLAENARKMELSVMQ